jgi:hypothetical protein
VHEAHEPDLLGDFADADVLSGKDLTQIDFSIAQADTTAVGDGDTPASNRTAVTYAPKIVLNCIGDTSRLPELVEEFIRSGVVFVGVVGKDCIRVEDMLDEIVVRDGSRDYELLTSSHPNETLEGALSFARSLTGELAGDVQAVDLSADAGSFKT